MRVRVALPYALCLIGGMAIGVIFGDRVFPDLEEMFGDPAADICLGILVALFAAIAYAAAAMSSQPD